MKPLIIATVIAGLVVIVGFRIEASRAMARGPWLVRCGIGSQTISEFVTTNEFYETVVWETNITRRGFEYVGKTVRKRWSETYGH